MFPICVFEQRNPLRRGIYDSCTSINPNTRGCSLEMLRTPLLKTYLLNCCLLLTGLYVFPIFATLLHDLCFLELCNVFVFCFLCVARTITPTQTCGWRGTEGKWGGGRYSFKKMEEHALEGHSETGQLKTVPFCCLFFPCQDWFLPRYFTLCLSQNSLSIG